MNLPAERPPYLTKSSGAKPWRKRWWATALSVVVTLAAVSAGCSSDDNGQETQASDDAAQPADEELRCVTGGDDVDWSRPDYARREVKTRVGEMACAGDCDGLRAELDLANDNAAAVRVNYPGEGNDALIKALDATLKQLEC